MENDQTIARKALLDYLERPRAHVSLKEAAADMSEHLINKTLEGVPYSCWGLLEHIRTSQRDMVDFMENPEYKEMKWPDDFWPDPKTKATKAMWDGSVAAYEKDLAHLKDVVKDPKTDLFARIPWGEGQTVFREVMQIIDHAAYHTGELVLARRMMGSWPA
jgi:hypothetical protein